MRRLLVVNPNANPEITAGLVAEARRVAGDALSVEGVNAASGLGALETPEHIRLAADAVVRAIEAARPDAALIGAFGDPGLAEARALGLPVAGLGEAGLLAAGRGRFAVVTLGPAMAESIRVRIHGLGLGDRLVALRLLPGGVADYAAKRDVRLGELSREVEACARAGAETVLLGGAPFAGQARLLSGQSVRVLDGVESAVSGLLYA